MLKTYFRTARDLLYWNFRKARFRRKGCQGRAPCQHPSDSGLAGETSCTASKSWRNPAEFKRICPLLVDTPEGLRCSVDAADVRPFWGPVFAFYGKTAAVMYLVAVVLIFAFLTKVGYPVRFVHLAWPGSWPKVFQARNVFLVQKAKASLEAGRVREGLMFLQAAREADPKNYSVGLDLALLYRTALPASADAEFERLLADHPEKRNETALLWLDSLVMHAEFQSILRLSQTQLRVDPAHGDTWTKALVFSSRQLHAPGDLEKFLADPAGKLDAWRACLTLEIALQEENPAAVNAALREPWTRGEPAYASVHRLLAMAKTNQGIEALDLIQKHQAELDPADRAVLALDILSELKQENRLAAQVDLLLANQESPDTIRMLCTHVVRYRDRAMFRQLYAKVGTSEVKADRPAMWVALLCAAGAVKESAAVDEIAAKLREAHVSSPLVTTIQSFFEGASNQEKFSSFLPWLGLSREENYALLENPPSGGPRERSR